MSKIVAGKEISGEVLKQMTEHADKQNKNKPNKTKKATSNEAHSSSPQPGPSKVNTISDSSGTENEEDLCYQCKRFSPEAVRHNASIFFVKWAQCDNRACNHWVHLSTIVTLL
ncbi:hypothetical protein DPMN_128592 [Dreissena polymorpha]|uniref:Uncharacterized protein n=1 Tax=Dreissena polymorpha TaxID=45954 RepID=A0A9D4H7G3_DREPO|nr:hypothetical protein DPMN_128592 [Dreissena polymorpha]